MKTNRNQHADPVLLDLPTEIINPALALLAKVMHPVISALSVLLVLISPVIIRETKKRKESSARMNVPIVLISPDIMNR